MAGGPHAHTVACVTCAMQGTVTPAARESEGLENDWYVCAFGHRSGIDWSRGAPTTPAWPPSPEEHAQIAAIAAMRLRR